MNFEVYECDTCKREVTHRRESSRVRLLPCTITKGCLGTLQFTRATSTPPDLLPAPVQGLTDWSTRFNGTTETAQTAQSERLLSTSTSGKVTLALPADFTHTGTVSVACRSTSVTPLEFREFLFVRPVGTTVLTGNDDNGGYLLSIPSAASVRVFIGANELARQEYVVERSPAKVTLVNAISEKVSIVRVIVTVPQEVASFSVSAQEHSLATANDGAWTNLSSVEIAGTSYQLFNLDLTSQPAGVEWIITEIRGVNVLQDLSDAYFLLANTPYDFTSRDVRDIMVVSASLSFYKKDDAAEVYTLATPTPVFPYILTRTSGLFSAELTAEERG